MGQYNSNIKNNSNRIERGNLKIFFGYAPYSGTTYAMLQAAHEAKKKNLDVVIGYINPQCCTETVRLKEGLEVLPDLEFNQNGSVINEFDLDSAIKRNPKLIVVDDLFHLNASGCRHKKRYQDIRELLYAGIDVYSTLGVQNLESMNDMIAALTGEKFEERIPDFIFDTADQVEFIDIEPTELLQRMNKFFQNHSLIKTAYTEETLIALREIAMRCYSERINSISQQVSMEKNSNVLTGEHILVCLSPASSNAKIIRTAARMAHAFRGMFTALYVETSDYRMMDERNKERLRANMQLAQQLGAEVEIVYGDDVPFQISEYARLTGVSKIVIGRSSGAKKRFFRKATIIERLLIHAPKLDVYVIPDQDAEVSTYQSKIRTDWLTFAADDIVRSVGILVFTSLLGYLFEWLGFVEANIITVYVLAVLIISVVTNNRVYSLISSIVSVLVFNFLFTDPKYSLQAYDNGYPVTFVVMFIAAFLTGTLATKLKRNAKMSAQAAFRIKVLFDTNQLMQQSQNNEEILTATANQLLRLLKRDIIIYPAEKGQLKEPLFFPSDENESIQSYLAGEEKRVAEWVMNNNKHAGATTQTFSEAKGLYLAIRVKSAVYGVIGIGITQQPIDAYENSILLSILGECALALENRKNAVEKEQAAVLAKNEQLRANLLRTISHDLRTPLTSISGNASNLLYNGESFDATTKQRLYQDIYDDSMWLINLVENLLSVTRLEEGRLNLHISAELVDEVVEEALKHVKRLKPEHKIVVKHQDDLLLAKMDARLIVQVLINLIDNAIKYTPKDSNITIKTEQQEKWAVISVIDEGLGVPDENKDRIFEMFYSDANRVADSRRSLGLGLALCKSIVNAHGGDIKISDNSPHGAIFKFTLPIEEVKINEQSINFSG